MVQRIRIQRGAILLSVLLGMALFFLSSTSYAFAKEKPALTLNLQQGPLGVTLHLKGKNFHRGVADFSYIDAQGVPGMFVAPSTSSANVEADGTFDAPDILLPGSGTAGVWQILATDNAGSMASVHYTVLAVPGNEVAGIPSLTINPTTGTGGDLIAFTGSNWLPAGTEVSVSLLMGTSPLPLLDTAPVSDKNGSITGAFHLPANLTVAQASVTAADVATGALRAQALITLIDSSPTPTSSATVTASASPVPVMTPTPVKNIPLAADSSRGSLTPLEKETWGIALLVVGGTLGVAATMLILFLIPWNERKRNASRGGHY